MCTKVSENSMYGDLADSTKVFIKQQIEEKYRVLRLASKAKSLDEYMQILRREIHSGNRN